MYNNLFRDPDNLAQKRKRQINTLKIFNDNVTEIVENIEYQVVFKCNGKEMCLIVTLGPKFPLEKPILKISPVVNHPWVLSSGEIYCAPGLLNFTVHSDLGRVVQAIVREFVLRPPLIDSVPPQANTQQDVNTVSTCSALSPNNFMYSAPPTMAVPYQDFTYSTNTLLATSAHPLTFTFPELNSLTLNELQELNENPDRLDQMIESLPKMQALNRSIDELVNTTESLARENLEREPELFRLKQEVQESLDILCRVKADYEKFNLMYQHLCEKFNPHSIRESLRQSVTQIDEESEQLADTFLAGDMDLDKFLNCYISHRMVSHSRKVKDEKLSQQLEELKRAGY